MAEFVENWCKLEERGTLLEIETLISLLRNMLADQTFTTRWSGGRVQV